MNQVEEYRQIAREYFINKQFVVSNLGNVKNMKFVFNF